MPQAPNVLEAGFQEELEALQAKDLFRSLRTLERVQPPYAYFEGQKITLFCGNDYLGLSRHPRLIAAAKHAADTEGTGAGAARLISGTTAAHTLLEKQIAALKGKEKALVFSAGYLANLGTLSALAGPEDLIVMDKYCHASLIDGARLSQAQMRIFPHKQYDRCEEILENHPKARRKILVTDSVFSMDGDLADLKRLADIKRKYQALLVVDDAHGTGVMGFGGRGLAEDLGLESEIDVFTGTFSKALGCLGGFAAGSEVLMNYLINSARSFIFATALPPLLCAALSEAICLLKEDPSIRHKLWQNIQLMHHGLKTRGFIEGEIVSPIFPVIIGEEKEALRISKALFEKGFWIPAVRTPAVPKGKARLRITASALHSEQDIQKLLTALKHTVPARAGQKEAQSL